MEDVREVIPRTAGRYFTGFCPKKTAKKTLQPQRIVLSVKGLNHGYPDYNVVIQGIRDTETEEKAIEIML